MGTDGEGVSVVGELHSVDHTAASESPTPGTSPRAVCSKCCLLEAGVDTRLVLSLSPGPGQRHGARPQPTDHTCAGHCLRAPSPGPLPLSVEARGPQPAVDRTEEEVGLGYHCVQSPPRPLPTPEASPIRVRGQAQLVRPEEEWEGFPGSTGHFLLYSRCTETLSQRQGQPAPAGRCARRRPGFCPRSPPLGRPSPGWHFGTWWPCEQGAGSSGGGSGERGPKNPGPEVVELVPSPFTPHKG